MTNRVVRNTVNDLEPQLAIELGRLEAVCGEHDLTTPAASRLRLRHVKKTMPNSLASISLVYPNLADFTAPAPCVSTEPGDYLTLSIATKNSKAQRIDDPGHAGVELVQAAFQKVDLLRCRIRSDDQRRARHIVLRHTDPNSVGSLRRPTVLPLSSSSLPRSTRE
jgi:hypothetical protein